MTEENIKYGETVIKNSLCHSYNKGFKTGVEVVQKTFNNALEHILTNVVDRECCKDVMEFITKNAIEELSIKPDMVEVEYIFKNEMR